MAVLLVRSSAQRLGGSHTTLYHFHLGILRHPDDLYRMFSSTSLCHALTEPYLSPGEHPFFVLLDRRNMQVVA